MKITLTQAEAKAVCFGYYSTRLHGLPIEVEIVDPQPSGLRWHNPDGLTPEQVGVAEGWRLLTVDEVTTSVRAYDGTQWFKDGKWTYTDNWCAHIDGRSTLRTKHPVGFFNPPREPRWFNPDNLTPEQVGVSEGWRLLTVDEVSSESREYPETQWYRKGVWQRTSTWNASREGCCTLRTKHPIGYYKR